METKMVEIRDKGTFIPAIAIRLGPRLATESVPEVERYLLARAGFGVGVGTQREYVILMRFNPEEANYDPQSWRNKRTMPVAHQFIIDHFAEMKNGAVIDVEWILKESESIKESEAVSIYE